MISLPRPPSVAGLAGAVGAAAMSAPVQPLLPLPPAVHGLVLGVVALHGYGAGTVLALLAGTSGGWWPGLGAVRQVLDHALRPEAAPGGVVGTTGCPRYDGSRLHRASNALDHEARGPRLAGHALVAVAAAAAVLASTGPAAAAVGAVVLVLGVLVGRGFQAAVQRRDRRVRPPVGRALAGCLLVALPVVTAAGAPAAVADDVGAEGRSFLRAEASPSDGATPVRVYAGLGSAPTVPQRVDRALAALTATGGFRRSTVLVAVPTGSGWVNRAGVGALERLTGGDTATVVLQYAQRPSWLEYALGSGAAEESAAALVRAVRARIDALPTPDRPRLLLYGESLGAIGAAAAADDADGVLVAGTPAGAWAPPDGPAVLHADDPVVWFSPRLLVARPQGWQGEWLPVVSFWTTAAGLLSALDAPPGHGHRYGEGELTAGWRAVLGDAQPLTAPEARPAT